MMSPYSYTNRRYEEMRTVGPLNEATTHNTTTIGGVSMTHQNRSVGTAVPIGASPIASNTIHSIIPSVSSRSLGGQVVVSSSTPRSFGGHLGNAHHFSAGHNNNAISGTTHRTHADFFNGSASHRHGEGRIISTVTGEARATGQSHVIGERQGEPRYTGETRIVQTVKASDQVVDTRVVGVERGAERQISVTEIAMGEEIIGQHTVQTGKGRRGRKVIREEVIEKVIVVPETVQIEEWIEDEYDMEETVIEVAKKIQIEKVVEVNEVEIVEKVIEHIEKVIYEKIFEVPVIETIERIVEIPIIQTVEKIVEVPEIQYRDIPVDKIVEVPEMKTEEVIREVKRMNFVDKPIEQKKLIFDEVSACRKLPIPVEAETIIEFTVPPLRANYVKKKFPVYLPRFIEVPVSRQFIDAGVASKNEAHLARLKNLTSSANAVSLCEIEGFASEYRDFEATHRLTEEKTFMDGSKDHSIKSMLASHNSSLESHAVYRHLPVEVADVHVGYYSTGHLGSSIIYSSAQFGIRGAIGYSSSHTVSRGATNYSAIRHSTSIGNRALTPGHSTSIRY